MNFQSILLSSQFSIENIRSWPLWQQGLFVVVIGLVGVFLVLLLFYFTIILMEKISSKSKTDSKVEP
jgi:uncharacterized membrane protein